MSEQHDAEVVEFLTSGKAYDGDDLEAEIHPDFTQPVVVDTTRMAWQATPSDGVWRRRLELIGSKHPQLTTIVRFEPGSHFDAHGHPEGEEYLVLSGTLLPGSKTPGSVPIFVPPAARLCRIR